ncbi:hypothetical protein ACRTDU_06690 [Sunxiuqinia elliptica]
MKPKNGQGKQIGGPEHRNRKGYPTTNLKVKRTTSTFDVIQNHIGKIRTTLQLKILFFTTENTEDMGQRGDRITEPGNRMDRV